MGIMVYLYSLLWVINDFYHQPPESMSLGVGASELRAESLGFMRFGYNALILVALSKVRLQAEKALQRR